MKLTELNITVKTINLCNLARFMVSSNQDDTIRISCFQGQKSGKSFQRVISTIYVIPQKYILCVRYFSSSTKQFLQVIKLPNKCIINTFFTQQLIFNKSRNIFGIPAREYLHKLSLGQTQVGHCTLQLRFGIQCYKVSEIKLET